jgi:hypothetical protein
MSVRKRITRPEPERTEPIRRWPTLFGVTGAAAAAREGTSGAAPRRSLNDAVSHSVDLGYRVIDEYIRQGQRAAQRFNDRSYSTQAMTNDVQELAMRVGQYASEFAAVWLDLVQATMAGVAERRPAAGSNGDGAAGAVAPSARPAAVPAAAHGGSAAAAEPARVRIAITSPRPAEVSLDIRPDSTARPLLVYALRAVDPDKPRVTDVVFEAARNGEPATLRLRVPAEQPAGVYSAVIVEADTNRPAGTISLQIAAE